MRTWSRRSPKLSPVLRQSASVRAVPVMRAANVHDPGRAVDRPTIFFSMSYDMVGLDLDDRQAQVSLISAIRLALSGNWSTFELWEPLWIREFPRWCAVGCAAALSRSARGKGRKVVFYAIENSPIPRVLFGDRSTAVPPWISRAFIAVLRCVLRTIVDRIAFGTAGAQATYLPLTGGSRVESRLIVGLPSPNSVLRRPSARQVLFVGVLEPRKGIDVLMEAWERVELEGRPCSILIVGGGDGFERVSRWARAAPATRTAVGWVPRQRVTEFMRESSVLVAPSLPDGRWTEQIGLPIVEALSLGLTVVTTDQTGISDELASMGHFVVPLARMATELGPAISAAMIAPLPIDSVVSQLPKEHGHAAADRWLHSRASLDISATSSPQPSPPRPPPWPCPQRSPCPWPRRPRAWLTP